MNPQPKQTKDKIETAADIYVEEMKTEGLLLGYNYSKVDCDLVKESFIDGANWQSQQPKMEKENECPACNDMSPLSCGNIIHKQRKYCPTCNKNHNIHCNDKFHLWVEPIVTAKDMLRQLIGQITVNESNFKHIIDSGKINGSLLIDIEYVVQLWHERQSQQAAIGNTYTSPQHSYSEQEVITICKQLLIFAELYRKLPLSLEEIDFLPLLKKNIT